MSVNIPTHFVQQYSTNVQLLLQQKDSKMSGRVTVGSHVGKQASPVDQFGKIEMQTVSNRFQPMGRVDASTDRRWVFPGDYDLPQLIDSFDKLRLLTDPQSIYVQNAIAAANRKKDAIIAAACFADAKTGEAGATTTSFGATTTVNGGQNIAVATGAAAATGLNVAKLRELRRAAMANYIDLDMESIVLFVTAKQHDNLLAEAQIISTDFNERPVLVEGKITRFMGIDIVHYEGLTTGTDDASGTSRALPAFVKSGMYLGMWNEVTTDISQRKDLQGLPYQVYLHMTLGATRLEEDKVFRVWCRE